jgi:hypothetical protein
MGVLLEIALLLVFREHSSTPKSGLIISVPLSMFSPHNYDEQPPVILPPAAKQRNVENPSSPRPKRESSFLLHYLLLFVKLLSRWADFDRTLAVRLN